MSTSPVNLSRPQAPVSVLCLAPAHRHRDSFNYRLIRFEDTHLDNVRPRR